VLLSAYFGTTEKFWINLQAHYDLEMAKDRIAKHAARVRARSRGSKDVNPSAALFNADIKR
jgi:plasmid maintenance system antidote protein VapI